MLKFISRGQKYIQDPREQVFVKDFAKYVKNFQKDQKLLNSYDLTILDRINHADQDLQKTIKKNEEWFYKEILREQHIGIELINRYFKQRYRYGFQDALIAQTLNYLAKAQSLLPEDDPGYPDILGKNLFISRLYESFSQDLHAFFSPRFDINSDDFATAIKSLAKIKMKDHNIILNVLSKIKSFFNLESEHNFNLKITQDLKLMPVLKGKVVDQQKFKEYLIDILSIDQSQHINKIENEQQEQEDFDHYKDKVEELDEIFNRSNKVLNNTRALQFQFFSSIKTLRENYFQLNQDEKKEFIKNDPYLLLSLQQYEYQLMRVGILSPRDLIIDESDKDADTQLEQIFADQIQNLLLNPNLLNLSFVDYQQQIKYDIDALIEGGKNYEFDQNIDSLYNLVQMLKNVDSIREHCKDDLQQKYQDTKDQYEEQTQKFQYYYTITFNKCQKDIQIILDNIVKENLTFIQLLKLSLINQDALLDFDFKPQLLDMLQNKIGLTQDNIEFILLKVGEIDQDILQKVCIQSGDQILQYITNSAKMENFEQVNNFVCVLTMLFDQKQIQQDHLKELYRKMFSLGFVQSLNGIENIENKLYIDHMIFALKHHRLIDYQYYENKIFQTLFQSTITKLSNLSKDFEQKNNPVLDAIRKSFDDFQQEQNFMFQIQKQYLQHLPTILNFTQSKIVFIDLLSENVNQNNSMLKSRNLLISSCVNQSSDAPIECYSKTIKVSDLVKNKSYYKNFDFDLKDDLKNIVKNTYKNEENDQNKILIQLQQISKELIQNDNQSNQNFILSKLFEKLSLELQKYQNNNIIKNRINTQIEFLLGLVEDQNKIDLHEIRQNIQEKENDLKNSYQYNFIGKRQTQNHNLNEKFDNYETKILNFQLLQNPEYFWLQSWEADLKNRLTQNQFYQTNDFILQDFGRVRKILLPDIPDRKQRKIQDLNIFWEYYIRQDLKIDQKNKLYAIEQLFQDHVNLEKSEQWKIALLNFSYEFRTQQNLKDKINKLFQMKFFNKLLKPNDQQQNTIHQSIFCVKELNKLILEKVRVISPYEKLITPYIIKKKQIDYYQQLVHTEIPEKIKLEQDQQKLTLLRKELEDAKLNYHKLMESFQTDFSLNYNQMEQKFLTRDYTNVLSFKEINQTSDENQEIYNIEQAELLLINNLYKNLMLYKQQNKLQLSDEETEIFKNYENEIRNNYLKQQVLIMQSIPNLKVGEIFEEKDYDDFENLFPYTNIREFKDQNIKDLLIIISLHLNTEQINNYESLTYIENKCNEKNMNLNVQQQQEISMLFNDQPQTQQNFNSLYNENKTYHNAQKIDDFEKKVYLEIFSLDRGGSDIDKKWLKQDQEELSNFIDQVNMNSSNPRKDMQNCNLKRFSKKVV